MTHTTLIPLDATRSPSAQLVRAQYDGKPDRYSLLIKRNGTIHTRVYGTETEGRDAHAEAVR